MHTTAIHSVATTQTWLKAASALVVGFGAIVGLAAHPATAGVTSFFADLLLWPLDGKQSISTPEARLLCAIGGGVMIGWGVMLWLAATRLYPRDPALARTMLLASVGAWFVADGIGSIVAGAPLNAALNLTFLALFYWPLRQASDAPSPR